MLPEWRPLSNGKIEDGQRVLDEVLSGLTDRVLTTSSVLVQRGADAWTRARPEERKELLAAAAGLDVYTDLGLLSAKHLNGTQREHDLLESQAAPLRARAEAIPRIKAEHAAAERDRAAAAADEARLAKSLADATDDVERATERAAAYEKALETATRIHGEVKALEAERGTWTHKADVAREMLAQRAELERARAELAGVRSEIQRISDETARQQEAAAARERERSAAIAKRADVQAALQSALALRARALAGVDAELRAARRQRDELAESGCLERCAHVDACTVRSAADENAARIRDLEEERERHDAVPEAETALALELAAVVVPDRLPITERTVVVDQARRKERDLEAAVLVADKIAKAEAVLEEHDQAVAKIDEQLAPKKRELGQANGLCVSFAGDPRAERERALGRQRAIDEELRTARATVQEEGTRAAMLAGRLEELRTAAKELEGVEAKITESSRTAAAWKELVVGWRMSRVAVLETSLIPQVEQVANEVLRRLPHGIQIALRTQREKKSGDGISETLDVEVIGKGELYEMCSGGEKTGIDFAVHVALAIVVSRRAATRLHVLVCDEPEGLDEPSRAAFAVTLRWIAETFDLRVLLMSHAEDLVDQLGAPVIRVGEPAPAPEPEAVPA